MILLANKVKLAFLTEQRAVGREFVSLTGFINMGRGVPVRSGECAILGGSLSVETRAIKTLQSFRERIYKLQYVIKGERLTALFFYPPS